MIFLWGALLTTFLILSLSSLNHHGGLKMSTLLQALTLSMMTLSFGFLTQNSKGLGTLHGYPSLQNPLLILTLIILLCSCLAFNQKMFLKTGKDEGTTLNMYYLLIYVLILMFCSDSFWIFYILYEVSVIPIIIILIQGGTSKKRGEAALFMLSFTIWPSMGLLFGALSMSSIGWTSGMEGVSPSFGGLNLSDTLFQLMMIFTFLVKFPAFFLQLWLPKAHVEAPVMGSMILAGVLLKMGGWGVEVLGCNSLFYNMKYTNFLLFFFLWGGITTGLLCYRQKDKKILIAYSSVNHMALCLVGLFSLTSSGWSGMVFIFFGHGILSSLLFFLTTSDYQSSSNRSLFKGVLMGGKSLLFYFIFILTLILNSGFPPFINFLGEMLVFSLIVDMPLLLPFFLLHFLMGGVYMITLAANMVFKSKEEAYVGGWEMNHPFLLTSLLHLSFFFFSAFPSLII